MARTDSGTFATVAGIGPTLPLAPIESEQRRRLQLVAAAMLAVVLLVLGVVVAFNRSEDPRVIDASSSSSTTTVAAPIVVPTTAVPTVPSTTPTSGPRATPRSTTTTIASPQEFADDPAQLVCVQTTKAPPSPPPSDWKLYWTDEPKPNEGLDLVICVDDQTPKVGATLKLYVLSDDKDAEIGTGSCDVFARWDSNDQRPDCPGRDTVYAPPSSPKKTPEPKRGRVTLTFVHQYAEPGEYVIDVRSWSGPQGPDRQPYASYNSIEIRVNVHR